MVYAYPILNNGLEAGDSNIHNYPSKVYTQDQTNCMRNDLLVPASNNKQE